MGKTPWFFFLTPTPIHIQSNLMNICTYKSNICAKYVVLIKIKFTLVSSVRHESTYYTVVLVNVEHGNLLWKGVITYFLFALLCLFRVITPFGKALYNAF